MAKGNIQMMETAISNPRSACMFLYFSIPTSFCVNKVCFVVVSVHGWKRKPFQENIRKKKKTTLAQFPEDI